MKFILFSLLFSVQMFSQDLFVKIVPSDTVLVNTENAAFKITLINKKSAIGVTAFFDLDRSYISHKVFLGENSNSKTIDVYEYLNQSMKSNRGNKNLYQKSVFILIKDGYDTYSQYKANHKPYEIADDDDGGYLRTEFIKN